MKDKLIDFLLFGWKQAINCLFPAVIFITLWLSTAINLPIAKYDFIFLVLLSLQVILLATKYENLSEVKVVMIFHVLGLFFEIAKVNAGRWSYPEEAFFMILNVPLYSGFLYASVASYVLQANKRLKLKYINWPTPKVTLLISGAIYLNFFTNLFIHDLRIILFIFIFLAFYRVVVEFTPREKTYKMPMILAFGLIAIYIWIAENISTFFEAWVYPHQSEIWKVVDINIVSSWFLLVVLIISLVNWDKTNSEN